MICSVVIFFFTACEKEIDLNTNSYENAIVVSPLIHRMLHYATVSNIDLTQIKKHKLKIKINEKDFEITWHPEHTKTVVKSLKD